MKKEESKLEFSDKPFEDKVITLILSDGRLVSTNSHQEDINRILFDLFEAQGRLKRMLHWLIAEMIHTDKDVVGKMRLMAECNQPDITDILEGK